MPNTLAYHFCKTKESMDSSILENIGTLNSQNNYTLKDIYNPKPNHLILSDMTNTINGYAFYSLSTTCYMSEVTIPLRKNSKILSATDSTSNFSDLHSGSYKCASTNTRIIRRVRQNAHGAARIDLPAWRWTRQSMTGRRVAKKLVKVSISSNFIRRKTAKTSFN